MSSNHEGLCVARATNIDPPQDCDWPFCGCDEAAGKVVAAISEAGWMSPKEAVAKARQEGSTADCGCHIHAGALMLSPYCADHNPAHPDSLLRRRIVVAAHRSPNTDGTIQPRDWEQQMVPTELIEEAEKALTTEVAELKTRVERLETKDRPKRVPSPYDLGAKR